MKVLNIGHFYHHTVKSAFIKKPGCGKQPGCMMNFLEFDFRGSSVLHNST